MTAKYLRFVYVCEFLIALTAIFTVWPEIGGQAALDLMHWGWKFGLGISLAVAIVAYSSALIAGESIWTLRSARWLAAIGALTLAMGVVTYFYTLEEDSGDSEDPGTISSLRRPPLPVF